MIINNANEKNLHFDHKPVKEQPLIQTIDIIDIENVPEQLTSTAKVTIPESYTNNPDKLITYKRQFNH